MRMRRKLVSLLEDYTKVFIESDHVTTFENNKIKELLLQIDLFMDCVNQFLSEEEAKGYQDLYEEYLKELHTKRLEFQVEKHEKLLASSKRYLKELKGE